LLPPKGLTPVLKLGLRAEVRATLSDENEFIVEGAGVRMAFGRLGAGLQAALHQLADTGEEEDRLGDMVLTSDGHDGLARLYYFIDRLKQRSLVTWNVCIDERCLASLVPTSPAFEQPGRECSAERSYVLSRFAYMRREGCDMLLESPLAHGKIVLRDSRATSLVHALSAPIRVPDLAECCPSISSQTIKLLMTLLLNAAMLVELTDCGTSYEDEHSPLQTWEFHDLMFHARSRNGRHDQPVGGTHRFLGRLPPLPAVEPVNPGQTIFDLYRPSLDRIKSEDLPFAYVQEMRSTVREYGPRSITPQELGEFLYRVARVRENGKVQVESSRDPVTVEIASRPYPGAGGLYELEIYAAVNSCDGLLPGLYRYDPLGHRLVLLRGLTPEVEALLSYAGSSIAVPVDQLQLLLILTARFQRIAWKYASVAYSLILKDAGVVFQTMYLVATAMGLAPCALGGGDADMFARASGIDYYAESSVGEFLLGARP